ncbi:MAG: SRPBCC family protein [Armatimonadetes bacterium]|nr:polyketide cyclase [Armatimonadota bacterium]MBS1703043.1 SRPBCC family protein [Armatimonadota bacterium]MBS1727610.1 SRPBCC family protein [Armatimonadota bacterium]
MSNRELYSPGAANVAHVEKDGDHWTLVVEKSLRHSPEKVWAALTEPEQLSQWSPFDADGNLGKVGVTAKLTTVGAPPEYASETTVTRAEAPHVLEYKWGTFNMLWQLEPTDEGTKLTLWTNIARGYIGMGAAGWHVCFDVLDFLLAGEPIGRLVAHDALHLEGWQRLNREYSEQFGIEVKVPNW